MIRTCLDSMLWSGKEPCCVPETGESLHNTINISQKCPLINSLFIEVLPFFRMFT